MPRSDGINARNAATSKMFDACVCGSAEDLTDSIAKAPEKAKTESALSACLKNAATLGTDELFNAMMKLAKSGAFNPTRDVFDMYCKTSASGYLESDPTLDRRFAHSSTTMYSGLSSAAGKAGGTFDALICNGLHERAAVFARAFPEAVGTLRWSVFGIESPFSLWARSLKLNERPDAARACMRLLRKLGVDPFGSTGRRQRMSPLACAVEAGCETQAMLLVEEPDFEHKGDYSPLAIAIEKKNNDLFHILLSSKKISPKTGTGVECKLPPLETAVYHKNQGAYASLRAAGVAPPSSIRPPEKKPHLFYAVTASAAPGRKPPEPDPKARRPFTQWAFEVGADFAATDAEACGMEGFLRVVQKKAQRKRRKETPADERDNESNQNAASTKNRTQSI